MAKKDVRWIQRFQNFRKALAKLSEATDMLDMSELEQEGLIQRFEYTFELAWKTLQDFVVERGFDGERGKPNLVITEAATRGLVDEPQWKVMTKARNQTSHTYDEDAADEIAENIVNIYHLLFIQLETRLQLEKINEEKGV